MKKRPPRRESVDFEGFEGLYLLCLFHKVGDLCGCLLIIVGKNLGERIQRILVELKVGRGLGAGQIGRAHV